MEAEYHERRTATMKRLIIVCEGPTEQEFCKSVLYDYFLTKDIYIETPVIKHSGGGVVPWTSMQRQIKSHLHEQDAYVTMFIDFYGIKDSYGYPQWDEAKKITNHAERVDYLENAMLCEMPEDVRNRFIPHLQLHEFETLLFSDISAFEKVFMQQEVKIEELREIIKEYPNPEDINNSPLTAPSKRIENAILGYEKVLYGNYLAMEIGMNKISESCPHFRSWIEKIENI